MPKVGSGADAGLLKAVLAYHADDEIARAVVKGEIVIGAVLVVIGIAHLLRLRGAPSGGRNRRARVAAVIVGLGIVGYVAYRIIPWGDDPGNAL